MKELRERIRDLREDHDLKQKAVAARLGISQQTYSNYENGHREIPISAVVALANYYKVSTDYLRGTDNGYPGSTNLAMLIWIMLPCMTSYTISRNCSRKNARIS